MAITIWPRLPRIARSAIVRNDMTHVFIYRLRNYGDLESIVEEHGMLPRIARSA